MALIRRGRRVYLYQTVRGDSLRKTQYVAYGPEAEALASALHSARLAARHDRLLLRCQRKADIDAILRADAEIDRMCEDIQLLVRAVLIASGFHTHKGQLRRRRPAQQATRVTRVQPRSQSPGPRSQDQSRKAVQAGRPGSAQAASRQSATLEAGRRPRAQGPPDTPSKLSAQHRVRVADSRSQRDHVDPGRTLPTRPRAGSVAQLRVGRIRASSRPFRLPRERLEPPFPGGFRHRMRTRRQKHQQLEKGSGP
jgi:hypothetical protein